VENKVTLKDGKLIIKLDKLEKGVLTKALPMIAPMVEVGIGMLVRIVLLLASEDKSLFVDSSKRIKNGEDPELVVKELLDRMNISPENLVPDIKMPPKEEINKILGWGDEVAFELSKRVSEATVFVCAYKSGKIECWAEPPIIDAYEYVGQILEEHNIPYKQNEEGDIIMT